MVLARSIRWYGINKCLFKKFYSFSLFRKFYWTMQLFLCFSFVINFWSFLCLLSVKVWRFILFVLRISDTRLMDCFLLKLGIWLCLWFYNKWPGKRVKLKYVFNPEFICDICWEKQMTSGNKLFCRFSIIMVSWNISSAHVVW